MKAFDKDGLLLCNLQATTFEMSIETESISSEVFIRRFMNSQVAKDLDNDGIPDRYDNDFKDSDYFESTYDVEDNLNAREEKDVYKRQPLKL